VDWLARAYSSAALTPVVVPPGAGTMARYGLMGKMTTQPGRRDELLELLRQGAALMGDTPVGCLLYLISTATDDEDALWITEVWTSKDAHDASLSIPGVREIIGRAMPLIAGMSDRIEFTPITGIGLDSE
jgi:quinol monooxygenase YgiN